MTNSAVTTSSLQLPDYAGFDVTSISLIHYPPQVDSTISESHSLHIFLATARSCMDLRRADQGTTGQRLRPSESHASLQQSSNSAVEPRYQAYSSPLPQSQWTDVPLPYRPRDWVDPSDRRFPSMPSQQQGWRLQPRIPGNALSGEPRAKTRRRPHGLRDVAPRPRPADEQNTDYSLLYPQMSPYENRLSSYSAPDEMQHTRSVSQPNSPAFFQQRFDHSNVDVPPPLHIPRSPTYPPAGGRGGRRRIHSHSGVTDAAFDDEAEFRLFVEATAGLGPEQAFRQSHPGSTSLSHRQRSSGCSGHGASSLEQIASPTEPTLTPTTALAMQQLAQMPEVTPALQPSPQPIRQRLETSRSGLDLWLQVEPPSAVPSGRDVSPLEDLDTIWPDDELPDYASSQAQAQASQRVEAARRAQELQWRWQASGGQRGLWEE